MIRAGVEAILSSLPDLVVVVVNIAVTRYEIDVGVTIPHSTVLGSHLANDSTSAGERGLTLHTSVTIGYDVPRRKVHEPLIAAARATEHLKAKGVTVGESGRRYGAGGFGVSVYLTDPEGNGLELRA